MSSSRQPAFTLIELMVVVAIIMITCSFGLVGFFRLQDRQLVENTAKEIIAYINQVRSYARNGDRGEGNGCKPNDVAKEVAQGYYKLRYWTIEYASGIFKAKARCTTSDNSDAAPVNGASSEKTYTLPKSDLKFCRHNGSTCESSPANYPGAPTPIPNPTGLIMAFNSLFGDTQPTGVTFIVYNTKSLFHYKFSLSNGALVNGCMCKKEDEDCQTKVSDPAYYDCT
jgi:type II secretory pathway pseudopilin PulG